MKNLLAFIFVLSIHISPSLAQSSIENVLVYSQSLEGNLLGSSPNRMVSVYLPSAYFGNPTTRYCVVYLLHGYTQNHSTFLNSFALKIAFDNFFNQGNVQPLIIVIPNAYNAYGGSWYTNSIVTGNWEDFITQDLVEYIDNNYRTVASNTSRGIAGYSMGGYGAMKIAMKHPEIYNAVYSLSAASLVFEDVFLGTMFSYLVQAANATQFAGLPWEAQANIAAGAAFTPNIIPNPFYCDFPIEPSGTLIDSVWQKWLLHDPYSMIDTYKNNLLQLDSIVFDCGTNDVYLFTANQNFDTALTVANIPNHFFDVYIGTHSDKIHDRVRDYMLPYFSDVLTDVEIDYSYTPNEYSLIQNYPNPFNPNTIIKYELSEISFITLKIYDVLGSEITTLVSDQKSAGYYEVEFDGIDLPSGVYFYQLKAGDFIQTKKMVLIK